jgi:hypothetical protein
MAPRIYISTNRYGANPYKNAPKIPGIVPNADLIQKYIARVLAMNATIKTIFVLSTNENPIK